MSNLQEIHDQYIDDFLAHYLHEAIQKIEQLEAENKRLEQENQELYAFKEEHVALCPQGW